jgi:hypothetical protein
MRGGEKACWHSPFTKPLPVSGDLYRGCRALCQPEILDNGESDESSISPSKRVTHSEQAETAFTIRYNHSVVVGDSFRMKRKSSAPHPSSNLPVSKQTAGGVAGAIVGGVIAGPIGAVAGAIAGTIMGNRAAKGKTLISPGTVRTASKAVKAVKNKLPVSKPAKDASKTPSASLPRPKRSTPTRSAKKPGPATKEKRTAVKRK